jgi:hypothetical protein
MSEYLIYGFLALLYVAPAGTWMAKQLRERRQRADEAGQPICGCKHHHAYHNPETGVCKQRVKTYTGHDGNGYPKFTWIDCPCQQYSGPVPLDMGIVRELQSRPGGEAQA